MQPRSSCIASSIAHNNRETVAPRAEGKPLRAIAAAPGDEHETVSELLCSSHVGGAAATTSSARPRLSSAAVICNKSVFYIHDARTNCDEKESRMIRLVGLWLAGCALCVAPVAAEEDMYDGPAAIRPLTVTPRPQHSDPPNTVCDFEHQCYPEKHGPAASAPVAPPAIVAQPIAPPLQVPDEPIVAMWRDCMDRALQTYEQSHDLHTLQVATGSCQVRLEEQGGEDYAGADPPVPPPASPRMGDRRNIGCGWWPIGSDADRDCAAGGRHF